MDEPHIPDAQSSEMDDSELMAMTEITRSPNYVHMAADSALLIDLGRDVEIAFLRVSPRPVGQRRAARESEEAVQVRFASEANEVGRVRMSPFGAIQIAMTTISKLVAAGHVDVSLLRSSIEEIIALAPAEGEERDAG